MRELFGEFSPSPFLEPPAGSRSIPGSDEDDRFADARWNVYVGLTRRKSSRVSEKPIPNSFLEPFLAAVPLTIEGEVEVSIATPPNVRAGP